MKYKYILATIVVVILGGGFIIWKVTDRSSVNKIPPINHNPIIVTDETPTGTPIGTSTKIEVTTDNNSTTPLVDPNTQTQSANTKQHWVGEYLLDPNFIIKNNTLYTLDENSKYTSPIGTINGNKLTIQIDKDVTVVFSGTTDLLDFFGVPGMPMFFYNDAQVGTSLVYPNSGYEVNKVTFKCDGRFTHYIGEPSTYFKCITNGIDQISQYEFTGARTVGFGTGGGYDLQWNKIYAKKINGRYIFVVLNLGGVRVDSEEAERAKENSTLSISCRNYIEDLHLCSESERQNYMSQKYLDTLLSDPKITKQIKEIDQFVDSLEIAK
jgi:hypothetical protein